MLLKYFCLAYGTHLNWACSQCLPTTPAKKNPPPSWSQLKQSTLTTSPACSRQVLPPQSRHLLLSFSFSSFYPSHLLTARWWKRDRQQGLMVLAFQLFCFTYWCHRQTVWSYWQHYNVTPAVNVVIHEKARSAVCMNSSFQSCGKLVLASASQSKRMKYERVLGKASQGYKSISCLRQKRAEFKQWTCSGN